MITCEPLPSEKHAVGGVIPDEAVVVHGCKDGSLHRLVIGENQFPGAETGRFKGAELNDSNTVKYHQEIAAIDPSFGPDKTAITARTELLAANLEAMAGEPTFQAVVSKMKDSAKTGEDITSLFVTESKAMSDKVSASDFTSPKPAKEQRVLEALNKMDQPRLGAVASLSKVDKEAIKKMLPALGYEILNAGWIRKLPTK